MNDKNISQVIQCKDKKCFLCKDRSVSLTPGQPTWPRGCWVVVSILHGFCTIIQALKALQLSISMTRSRKCPTVLPQLGSWYGWVVLKSIQLLLFSHIIDFNLKPLVSKEVFVHSCPLQRYSQRRRHPTVHSRMKGQANCGPSIEESCSVT